MLNYKTIIKRLKPLLVKSIMSYDKTDLYHALKQLEIRAGDALMVHSSWLPLNGFKGRPVDMIDALKKAVESSGLLVMPSLTYQNESSSEYLLRNEPMDVKYSISRMGLLSEVFRRGQNVHRSLSPTHPLVAWGNNSEEFVAGHESCLVPFGVGSPFDKLLRLKGKILTIDAPFSTITFTHFLEDRIASFLPFTLYEDALVMGKVIDVRGELRKVPVKVLSWHANASRREQRLVDELNRCGIIQKKRIGNTYLTLIECTAMTDCVDGMVRDGRIFFD